MDIIRNNQFIPNLLLELEIITCLCVLFSSDKLLTSINCCKILYQPNSFAHSLINLLYWAYWAHPLFLPRFGLRFVILQLLLLLLFSFCLFSLVLLLVFCLHVILINEFKTFENIVKFLKAHSLFLYFVFIKLIRFCVLVAFCLN